jgi:hypothetical protein
LEVLGDPFFDDDIFGVVLRSVSIRCQACTGCFSYLIPVPGKTVSEQGLWQQVLAVNLMES